MLQNTKQLQPIILDYKQANRKVTVVPSDEDRFVMSMQDAATACQIVERMDIINFTRQFKELLNYLGRWIKAHQNKILHSFLTTRDAGLLFIVIRKESKYDDNFESELTELDLKIAQNKDFNLINLSVLSLPRCTEQEYLSFVNRFVLQYKGKN